MAFIPLEPQKADMPEQVQQQPQQGAAAKAPEPLAELEDVNSAFADLVMESQEEAKKKAAEESGEAQC